MNILIVEDDPNLLFLWETVFTSAGNTVRAVGSAMDARSALMAEKFDLVLLDFYLGRETGVSVAQVATSSNADCRIVVVTGASNPNTSELFEISPAITSVLRKPVDIEHLLAVCDHISSS